MKLEVAFVSSCLRRHSPETILSLAVGKSPTKSCGKLDAIIPQNLLL